MSIGISYTKYRIQYTDDSGITYMTEELTSFEDDEYIINRAKRLERDGATNVRVFKYAPEEIYSSKSNPIDIYKITKFYFSMADGCWLTSDIRNNMSLDDAESVVSDMKRENPNSILKIINERTNIVLKTF